MIQEEKQKKYNCVRIVSFFWKVSELGHNDLCVGDFPVTEKFYIFMELLLLPGNPH